MKQKRSVIKACVLCAAALSFLNLSGCDNKPKKPARYKNIELSYAENHGEDYPTTQAAYYFSKMVEEKTQGKIKIKVYPSAALGDEISVLTEIQKGKIDFTRVSISPLSEFNPELNALQLPFIYKDSAHMWRVLDGEIGSQLLNDMTESKMMGLTWFDSGARNFYNCVRPVKRLDDLKGLKIRVQESTLMMELAASVGAQPIPLPYGEVYHALANGKIDGAENNWPSYEADGHYKSAKYICLDEHARVPEMVLVSKKTWDNFSEDEQKVIKDCALEASKYQRKIWVEKETKSIERCVSEGVEVTELESDERKKLQLAMTPLYGNFGADFGSLVKKIQSE